MGGIINLRIGLSQRVLYHNGIAYDSTERGWYQFLNPHSIIPIANDPYQNFNLIADSIDVLILSGGDDSAIRRVTEIKLASLMMLRKKPIIGICHGYFLLSELFGCGISDIEAHYNTTHEAIYAGAKICVNSFHSLCVNNIPSELNPLVLDLEGNIESWVHKKMPIGGVSWHPERSENEFALPDEINLILKGL